jgi:hypothetical protein
MDGKLTPYFGFWTFVAWIEVFCPVLSKSFGKAITVLDDDIVDTLLNAEVMM